VKKKSIAAIHRLSEIQESMLLHRGGPDAAVTLLRGSLRGRLDPQALAEAWRQALARHPVLRSSVHWRDLEHPVQVVATEAILPAVSEDWRDVPRRQQERRFEERLRELRERGLDLNRAPVMSWTLVRTSEEEHRFVWASHHILLDGWSSSLVLNEVLARYEACRAGRNVEDPARGVFAEYVAWSRSEQAQRAAAHWEVRAGSAWSPLCGSAWTGEARVDRSARRTFDSVPIAAVEAWARRCRVTVGSLLLGCWGLVLAETTGSDSPVLGFTASGRAAPFDGIDSMIGMFANSLPLQLRVDRAGAPADWFRQVFLEREDLQAVEHCSLASLLQAGGLSLRRPPFDTVVVFANYPAWGNRSRDATLELAELSGDVTSVYPLTLVILPGQVLEIDARYSASLFAADQVDALLERFASLVASVISESAATIADLLGPAAADSRTTSTPSVPPPSPALRSALRPAQRESAGGPAVSTTENQLMRVWNDLIEVQEFGLDDNFFDLGGNSLLVPRMISRVHQDFGVELPLGVVFGSPTVRELARAVDSLTPEISWKSLVGIRSRGHRAPLYMVHGLGGEVGWFYNLANYLDPEMPLYGLQAPPTPFSDLEAMAAHYVEEVTQHQPEGPYRLGGYCIGGGVAFEMARQLEAGGRRVDAVVLIDSVPQAHAVSEQAGTPARLAQRARRLMSKEPREIVASVKDFGQQAARRLSRSVRGPGREEPLELEDVLDMRTLPRVYHLPAIHHFRAMRDYTPRPYDGDVWLFRTDDDRFGEDFGWRSLVRGRLGIERVSGRHIDVLREPHVAGLGRKLDAVLAALA
jgi:thioesterase domain-containing protein